MRREWMIAMRKKTGRTVEMMAAKCFCSAQLLRMVEGGHITHPDIASDIARAYHMSVKQFESLVDEKHHTGKIPPHREPPVDHGLSLTTYRGYGYD